MVERVQRVEPSSSVFPAICVFLMSDRSKLLTLSVPDVLEAQRERAHVRSQLLRRDLVEPGVGVEPARQRPLARRQRDVVDVAGEDDVAEAEREAALVGVDARELPAADQRRDHAVDVGAEAASAAEGQLPRCR